MLYIETKMIMKQLLCKKNYLTPVIVIPLELTKICHV